MLKDPLEIVLRYNTANVDVHEKDGKVILIDENQNAYCFDRVEYGMNNHVLNAWKDGVKFTVVTVNPISAYNN
jgi:hypothetical protein